MTAFASRGARNFDDAIHCVIDTPQGIEITDLFTRTLGEGGPPGWPSYTWYEGEEAFPSGKFADRTNCRLLFKYSQVSDVLIPDNLLSVNQSWIFWMDFTTVSGRI